MPIVSIDMLATVGVIKDTSTSKLPHQAWDIAQNVQFRAGAVRSRFADASILSIGGFSPRALFFTASSLDNFLVLAGNTKVHVVEPGGTTRDITNTSGDFTATGFRWTGGTFNGIFILNNPTDLPQYWVPGPLTLELQALPNWPVAARAGAMRPFKNFLIALDITTSGVRDPYLVKWGHPADPGDVPVSWDPTDVTRDAGEFPLSDTAGYVVDGLAMRDAFIIYKEDAVWAMQYVGGVEVFTFRKLFSSVGMLGPKCVVELPDGQHVVLSTDDIYVHNGQTYRSIVKDRIHDYIFSTLSSTTSSVSYVVHHIVENEVWFCVPTNGATLPNKAFCWNYTDNTWAERDLHNTEDIEAGSIPDFATGLSWDTESTETWDEASDVWYTRSSSQSASKLYGAYADTSEVRELNVGFSFTTGDVVSRVERLGLGIPMQQDRPPDLHSVKFFRGLRPLLVGNPGTTVDISVGVQQHVTDAPTWTTPVSYVIGSSEFVDVRGTGRLLAVRFESTGVSWQLYGYEIDLTYAGAF